MRTLRVVGLAADGEAVICEDPDGGEQFQVPTDDRLRAAARGDITRLGQIQIELESHMRPREIQARIRAGESVDQVASSAGVDRHRVERFASPVLQERSRNAQLAQQAHPVRDDGPDVRTLGEVAAHAFGVRGQDYTQASWDAWRDDGGKIVVQLHWAAGRSDNRAHWVFTPGAHGGTVTPADEHAEELLNPHAHRAPRNLRPVDPTQEPPAGEGFPQPFDDRGAPWPEHTEIGYEAHVGELPQGQIESQVEGPPERPAKGQAKVIDAGIPDASDDRAAESPPLNTDSDHESPQQPEMGSKKKAHHPVVPAWEDVLLGVRSQRGS